MSDSGDGDRVIYLEDINGDGPKNVIQSLFKCDYKDPESPIWLIINSQGGLVTQEFAIYDAIKACRAPVHTIAIGQAASAAVLILAAGDHRRISSNSRVLIHAISYGTVGTVYEVKADAEECERLQRQTEELLARESNQKIGKIRKMMESPHDEFLTADQAVKMGFADEVVGPSGS